VPESLEIVESGRFKTLLEGLNSLDAGKIDRVVRFREILLDENTRQNLTRLTTPEQFLEGHVLDCLELAKLGRLGKLMDLGSGGGVPGLLCAVMDNPNHWILTESEGKKAEFLKAATEQLELGSRVGVFAGRAEEYLKLGSVDGIVARAVGPVGRIYRWIQGCSTWNKLILLKGPGWEDEWKEFQLTGDRKKLRIESDHHYAVGAEMKQRRIVTLLRA